MKIRNSIVLTSLLMFAVLSAAHANICYVDSADPNIGNGRSWATAYKNLGYALVDFSCDEIWVAKGIYKPTAGHDPSVTFLLNRAVAVYGGFVGRETEFDKRQPYANTTVLSGDIDDNDAHASDNQIDVTWKDINGTNSYHVVTIDGAAGTPIGASTVLDGFTITGGSTEAGGGGGGLLCIGSGHGSTCNPTLSNLIFSGNQAGHGGALLNDGSNAGMSLPSVMSCSFTGNFAFSNRGGGAIYDNGDQGTSSPSITASAFIANAAQGNGGAISNYAYDGASSPAITNVSFINNSADYAGAMVNVGVEHGTSSPNLLNVTFYGNSSTAGTVIGDLSELSGTSFPTLRNVILWDDQPVEIADDDGLSSKSAIDHSVIRGGCPWGATCVAIESADPLLSGAGKHGGPTPTVLPGTGGSAINNGSNAGCPLIDQRGFSRYDGHCDIGAVEWTPSDDFIFANGFEGPR